MQSKRIPYLAAIVLVVATLLASGCSTNTNRYRSNDTAVQSSSSSVPEWQQDMQGRESWLNSLGGQPISATAGPAYLQEGYTGWVYGNVIDVYYAADSNGQPTFIDFGPPNSDVQMFTAIVWGENLGNFSMDLDSLEGKEVAVYGSIYVYRSWYRQMELVDQSQISVRPS